MKHIGIVGITAEGASLCYRTICQEAAKVLGPNIHPEITINNPSFYDIFKAQSKKDWKEVARIILNSIDKLKKCGAEFVIIPANSVHYCFDEIESKSPLPVLSIIEIVSEGCSKEQYKVVGVLGTSLTMEDELYKNGLETRGMKYIVPQLKEQSTINQIIFEEIIPNKVTTKGIQNIIDVIYSLKNKGCDAVILGCTEIPIIINEKNSPLPFIDTTRLLAIKALEYSLK